MSEVITVAADCDGWVVSQASSPVRHRFASGRTAEAMARQLACALATEGRGAEVHIYLRDGALAGTFNCPPQRVCEPV
jgi:hypothetical protein